MKILAKALRDDSEFDLQLQLVGGRDGLNKEIDDRRVQRPGLAMAGFLDLIEKRRLQVLGNTELRYLAALDDEHRRHAVDAFFGLDIACVVVAGTEDLPACVVEAADRQGIAVFRTRLPSASFITRAHDFLDEHLSPEMIVHAVLVDVFGVGVMLTGQSGIGKSECALDLVLHGHRLVTDDVVLLKQRHRVLVGMGSPLTRHHMEVRGLGIIGVKDLFGAASVCDRKQIDLVVELVEWQPQMNLDRTGLDDAGDVILEVKVPKITLPVRPGRNLASIVEVAARNHLLKLQGYHAARELKERLDRQLAASERPKPPEEGS